MFQTIINLKSIGLTAILFGVIFFSKTSHKPELPKLNYNRWWGDGEDSGINDDTIRNFKINFSDSIINDLKHRIKNRRPITQTLENAYSNYGINSYHLEKILKYWSEGYNYKERIKNWNNFPHFKTKIQGLDIHFIKVKPKIDDLNIKVLPLLMLHGWPSSSREFHAVIPKLTEVYGDYKHIYEVIAPDLPGFGFSQGTKKMGLNPAQIAIIMRNLMHRLGYKTFYVQAGDWGSQCATHMVTLFPDEVLGFHTNMPISSMRSSNIKFLMWYFMPALYGKDSLHIDRVHPISKYLIYMIRESGYFHTQATKPDTIGVALQDSPSGLAAYILEKMAICANRDQLDTEHGGLENLDLDDVLDTVTISWLSNSITTSMRIYKEAMNTDSEVPILHEIPTEVPTAVLNYKYEVVYQPDCVLRHKFKNIVQSTTLDYGGHFAAIQTPDSLVEDLFSAGYWFLKFHSNRKL